MSLPKKEPKPLTVHDLVLAISLFAVGSIMILLWDQVNTLPHSGWLFIFGLCTAFSGPIRFIVKFFKQPINREDAQ